MENNTNGQSPSQRGEFEERPVAPSVLSGSDRVPTSPKRAGGQKKWIAGGVLALVILVAGIGFFVWHEQPSFCNAICHTPMDPYVEGYYSQDPALLGAVHEGADVTCLQCHESNIGEQLMEGASWIAGGYDLPLEQRSFNEGFCLNGTCHDTSREGLAAATDHLAYNPHSDYHEKMDCGDCHKVHEQSVLECSQCHSDVPIPDNWKAYGK